MGWHFFNHNVNHTYLESVEDVFTWTYPGHIWKNGCCMQSLCNDIETVQLDQWQWCSSRVMQNPTGKQQHSKVPIWKFWKCLQFVVASCNNFSTKWQGLSKAAGIDGDLRAVSGWAAPQEPPPELWLWQGSLSTTYVLYCTVVDTSLWYPLVLCVLCFLVFLIFGRSSSHLSESLVRLSLPIMSAHLVGSARSPQDHW